MPISVKRPLNSLYIHIPFCKEKCYYCSFVSLAKKNNYAKYYINSLIKEISQELSNYPDKRFNTIYIGGGTPSLLDAEWYKIILDKIKSLSEFSDQIEITLEANPGTVDLNYLKDLRQLGINRLSIGVQSFDNHILEIINRKHSSDEAIKAVEMAKDAGFDNISIDLIYGLPEQNLQIWASTLEIATKLNINHISAYGLKIEEGTRFAKNLPPNLPDEDMAAEMYIRTIEILESNNFKQYEISNFAKPGFESKHNLCYWHNEEYFGFGLSAHGYVNGVRYANTCDLEEYLENPLKKESSHEVTYQEMIEEAIFLGLRLTEGINIEDFKREYGFNLIEKYGKIIEKYATSGFMEIKDNNLRLSTEGILISNAILADFLTF